MTAPPETPTLSEARKDFLHGLFTTALEGGIGYWSETSEYHWATQSDPTGPIPLPAAVGDPDNFYAVIHPVEDGWGIWADELCGDTEEDKKPLTIDLAVMDRGARLMNFYVQGIVDGKGQPVPLDQIKPWREGHYYWQYVEAYNSNGDRGDYDAEVADMVVQWGLFGEVVYG